METSTDCPTVVLIGFLDTKYEEHAFVHDLLTKRGCKVITIDVSIQVDAKRPSTLPVSVPAIPVTHSPEDVCEATGTTLAHIRSLPRSEALSILTRGAESILLMYRHPSTSTTWQWRIHALLALGGSTSTALAAALMRHPALPIGLPKLCISTMATAGASAKEYVGDSDLVLMPAIVDFPGTLNRLSRAVLRNAACAVAGMAWGYFEAGREEGEEGEGERQHGGDGDKDPKLIAVTMFGVTTPGVTAACERLRSYTHPVTQKPLYEPVVFHATGDGGRAMERLVREGWFAGVLDITTTELADEVCGGILSAGPTRLTAAPSTRTPAVLSFGALDMANFGPRATVPAKYGTPGSGRKLHEHNESVTLLRTSPSENAAIGRLFASNLLLSPSSSGSIDTSLVKVVVPLSGFSAISASPTDPFWDPEADAACIQAVKAGLEGSGVEVLEVEGNVNDERVVGRMVELLIGMLGD